MRLKVIACIDEFAKPYKTRITVVHISNDFDKTVILGAKQFLEDIWNVDIKTNYNRHKESDYYVANIGGVLSYFSALVSVSSLLGTAIEAFEKEEIITPLLVSAIMTLTTLATSFILFHKTIVNMHREDFFERVSPHKHHESKIPAGEFLHVNSFLGIIPPKNYLHLNPEDESVATVIHEFIHSLRYCGVTINNSDMYLATAVDSYYTYLTRRTVAYSLKREIELGQNYAECLIEQMQVGMSTNSFDYKFLQYLENVDGYNQGTIAKEYPIGDKTGAFVGGMLCHMNEVGLPENARIKFIRLLSKGNTVNDSFRLATKPYLSVLNSKNYNLPELIL